MKAPTFQRFLALSRLVSHELFLFLRVRKTNFVCCEDYSVEINNYKSIRISVTNFFINIHSTSIIIYNILCLLL